MTLQKAVTLEEAISKGAVVVEASDGAAVKVHRQGNPDFYTTVRAAAVNALRCFASTL